MARLFDAAQKAAMRIRDDPEQKAKILAAAMDVQRVSEEHLAIAEYVRAVCVRGPDVTVQWLQILAMESC